MLWHAGGALPRRAAGGHLLSAGRGGCVRHGALPHAIWPCQGADAARCGDAAGGAGRAIVVVCRPGAAAARVVFLLAEGCDTTKEPEEQGFFETKDGFDTFPIVGVYEEAEAGE